MASSSRPVSTSTGISGCYQPHRQTAMPGQKSIYETFLGMREGGGGGVRADAGQAKEGGVPG